MATLSLHRRVVLALCLGAVAVGCGDDGSPAATTSTRSERATVGCSAETEDALVQAVIDSPQGLADDVADDLFAVRCEGELAMAVVCLLCLDGPGAEFELLFRVGADEGWHLVEIGGPLAIDAAASAAGITPEQLASLRDPLS